MGRKYNTHGRDAKYVRNFNMKFQRK